MLETLFWIGVVLLVWGPSFTVLFYSNGGREDKLAAAVSGLKASPSSMRRWWGMFLSLAFGKEWRWVLSALGLIVLLVLKLAER